MEKAQALGAASQALSAASQSAAAPLAHTLCVQPKLLWLCEGLSDPQHSPLPPCGCVLACVRESSSEAWRSLSEAMRSLAKPSESFC